MNREQLQEAIIEQLNESSRAERLRSTIYTSQYYLNNEDKDDVYISCNVFDEDYGDMMCIIPCKFNKETNKYEPAENDINYISNDDGDEVYPEYIPNSEMISAIPEDILEDLSLL